MELFGVKRNSIKITDSKVTGKGDFTVYLSAMGDNDNNSKQGDCATNKRIDNPYSGTSIKVTNKTNNTTYTFIKNDNGDLPNAVIDIWKTGVKKLGITSTNYDDIKQAVVYTYNY